MQGDFPPSNKSGTFLPNMIEMTKISTAPPKPPLNVRAIKEKPAAANTGGVRSADIKFCAETYMLADITAMG